MPSCLLQVPGGSFRPFLRRSHNHVSWRHRRGASAAKGQELAALLGSDTDVLGVTKGALRPETAAIAVPTTADGGNMAAGDFSLTAGWGHFGQGEAVMRG